METVKSIHNNIKNKKSVPNQAVSQRSVKNDEDNIEKDGGVNVEEI